MSEFLLLCAKVCCFMLVLIRVIWNFTVRYDRKNKIREVEKELAKNSEPIKYTFSSVFQFSFSWVIPHILYSLKGLSLIIQKITQKGYRKKKLIIKCFIFPPFYAIIIMRWLIWKLKTSNHQQYSEHCFLHRLR